MTPPLPPDDAVRDPLTAYANGAPDAVRAARPREPSEAQWEAVRRRVLSRLTDPAPAVPPLRRTRFRGVVAAAVLAVPGVVVWLAHAPQSEPPVREVAAVKPVRPDVPVTPPVPDPQPDSLAEFDVLPIAETDDVVLHRVPGDGWFPVGTHPLSGALALATADDVELEEPDPAWPSVTPAPGCAPMIYAAKPR